MRESQLFGSAWVKSRNESKEKPFIRRRKKKPSKAVLSEVKKPSVEKVKCSEVTPASKVSKGKEIKQTDGWSYIAPDRGEKRPNSLPGERRARIQIAKALLESRKTKCSRCGYSEFQCSLDLHHLDRETKEHDPHAVYNLYISGKCDYSVMVDEFDKCVPLCVNCHRSFHCKKWKYDELEISVDAGYFDIAS